MEEKLVTNYKKKIAEIVAECYQETGFVISDIYIRRCDTLFNKLVIGDMQIEAHFGIR